MHAQVHTHVPSAGLEGWEENPEKRKSTTLPKVFKASENLRDCKSFEALYVTVVTVYDFWFSNDCRPRTLEFSFVDFCPIL